MEMQLQAGCSCIIDSTFTASHIPDLLALQSRHPFTPIQVCCRAEAAELAKRYRRRAETGERHPGHLDQMLSDTFDAARLERAYRPLEIGGHTLEVDTTDFKDDDFQGLQREIETLVG